MSNRIEVPTHLTDLPNEIVLIIWKHLTYVEAMRSFGSIRCQRYIRLLEDYCYKSIDFYTTTFSTFQLCCTIMLDQYTVLAISGADLYFEFNSGLCFSFLLCLEQLFVLIIR